MSQLRIYRYPEWRETPYKYIELDRNTDTIKLPEDRAEPQEHDHRLDESISRTRRIITELILCNKFDLFCTFTFSQEKVVDRSDYKAIKKQLAKHFNNYQQRQDPHFKYLVIPEFHKDGAVHFHGTITAPVGLCTPLQIPKKQIDGTVAMVPNTKAYMNWPYYSDRFGYFSCSWIRDYSRCASYVSKYMTKEVAQGFGRHDKIVMHTQGLQRPELVDVIDGAFIPDFDETKGDKKFDWCRIAHRTPLEISEVYSNPDDYWERYKDEVERLHRPAEPGAWGILNEPLARTYFTVHRDYPAQDTEFEQTTLWLEDLVYGGINGL